MSACVYVYVSYLLYSTYMCVYVYSQYCVQSVMLKMCMLSFLIQQMFSLTIVISTRETALFLSRGDGKLQTKQCFD